MSWTDRKSRPVIGTSSAPKGSKNKLFSFRDDRQNRLDTMPGNNDDYRQLCYYEEEGESFVFSTLHEEQDHTGFVLLGMLCPTETTLD